MDVTEIAIQILLKSVPTILYDSVFAVTMIYKVL
jgi:hypothetical protein